MWRTSKLWWRRRNLRRFSSSLKRIHVEDEGDWFYSSEWWGTDSDGDTVLRSTSDKGNGVVSVVAYPSSRPGAVQQAALEKWLQQRYGEICSENGHNGHFDVLGYQWRVLRFNDFTRQSTVKVMAAHRKSDPGSFFFMQQPHILAVPYLKSMISVGLTTLASSSFDFAKAVYGEKTLQVLCIGHGGGSLPLFLASKIQGAVVHIVEIDPLVISASIQAMGFPAFSMMKSPGERALPHPKPIDELLWKGTHERLFLFESDAENFILNNTNIYDLVFIDAYDGEDIFPCKFWDPESPFLETLKNQVHPKHGTVVVNLHADVDIFDQFLPMGKYVSKICQAYKNVLAGQRRSAYDLECSGLGYIVQVPWLCNASLVVCRGLSLMQGSSSSKISQRDLVLNTLMSKSLEVENLLNLPFTCLEYIKRGFVLVD